MYMINATKARTKANGVIANIKELAIKDLMPQVNDAIEAAIGKGNKGIQIVISNELNDTQKSLEEQSRIVFIKYKNNEHVITAIMDELKQYGYAVGNGYIGDGLYNNDKQDYMSVFISWAEDNAKG